MIHFDPRETIGTVEIGCQRHKPAAIEARRTSTGSGLIHLFSAGFGGATEQPRTVAPGSIRIDTDRYDALRIDATRCGSMRIDLRIERAMSGRQKVPQT
jgi:hypothetical protein